MSTDMRKTRRSSLVLGQLRHNLIHIRCASRLLRRRWLHGGSGGLRLLAAKHSSESVVLGLTELWELGLGRSTKARGLTGTRDLGEQTCQISIETRRGLGILSLRHGAQQLRECAWVEGGNHAGNVVGLSCWGGRESVRWVILRHRWIVPISRRRRLRRLDGFLGVVHEHSGCDEVQVGIFWICQQWLI